VWLLIKQHQPEPDASNSHYAEPTLATSLKKHSKQTVRQKPVERSRLTIRHGVERNPTLPHHAQACGHHSAETRLRSSERTCVSDNDNDGGKSRRYFSGRRSFSDDELSVRPSPRSCRFCRRHCHGRRLSSDSVSSTSSAQSHDNRLHRERAHSPRPSRRRRHTCKSSASMRCSTAVDFSLIDIISLSVFEG